MKRIVSLWLPTLATDRLARISGRTRPDPTAAPPWVTASGERGRLVVVAANRPAATFGIASGMPLADARALYPGLAVAEADPAGDARVLDRLAAWCGRYTPWTAVDWEAPAGTGSLWLDVTGCAHLFGGEAALLDDLVRRVNRFGFAAGAAMADSGGAAWAWARYRGADDDPVLPPGGARPALAALPVAALRLEPQIVETLDRLGLRRVGELYGLPRAALAARFGDTVRRRLDQALGHLDEPISPRQPIAPFIARLAFPEPVTRPEDVAAALQRLLGRLCPRLEAEGLGARHLTYTLHRTDGSIGSVAAGTSRPSHDPGHLERLLAPKLESLDPAGTDGHSGTEVAVLAIPASAPFVPDQIALRRLDPAAPREIVPGASQPAAEAIATPQRPAAKLNTLASGVAALADRLAGRLGAGNVVFPGLRESHWPERAAIAHPVLDGLPPPAAIWPRSRRPLHLLRRPEPVEITAEAGSREAPAAFRWRAFTHRVRRAEGPERIEPEWWRTAHPASAREHARDYYRIEDRDGRRFWMFREAAGESARWFLHGLFA